MLVFPQEVHEIGKSLDFVNKKTLIFFHRRTQIICELVWSIECNNFLKCYRPQVSRVSSGKTFMALPIYYDRIMFQNLFHITYIFYGNTYVFF